MPGVISVLRIIALYKFYHAPLDVAHHFEYKSIPSILSSLGHAPIPPPKSFKPRPGEKVPQEWDYSPLARMDNKVTLCYGTEWHRFPGSYLVPEGVEVRWIKTDFDGMMPRRWEPSPTAQGGWPREETRTIRAGRFNGENKASSEPGTYVSSPYLSLFLGVPAALTSYTDRCRQLQLPCLPYHAVPTQNCG